MQGSNKIEISKEERHYNLSSKFYFIILFTGIFILILLIFLSLCLGNYHTTVKEVFNALLYPKKYEQIYNIITLSRLPRLLASIFVGAALSTAGLVYQDTFFNKMASPDLLGVSAGAGCGASCAIIFGFGFIYVSICAFFGGIIAVFLTIVIAKFFGKGERKGISLILSGIIVGGLMNSILGLFKYVSSDTQLSTITFWLLGGFNNVTYNQLKIVIPFIIIGVIILYLLRWKILMLKNGDIDAKSHGINANSLRYVVIICSTIITALSVCISGTIGWIGLAIPNLMRLLVNNDSRRLMPITIVYGMAFTLMCDLLARTLTKAEIPVGIFTGLLGAILFIIILIVRKFQNGKYCN